MSVLIYRRRFYVLARLVPQVENKVKDTHSQILGYTLKVHSSKFRAVRKIGKLFAFHSCAILILRWADVHDGHWKMTSTFSSPRRFLLPATVITAHIDYGSDLQFKEETSYRLSPHIESVKIFSPFIVENAGRISHYEFSMCTTRYRHRLRRHARRHYSHNKIIYYMCYYLCMNEFLANVWPNNEHKTKETQRAQKM